MTTDSEPALISERPERHLRFKQALQPAPQTEGSPQAPQEKRQRAASEPQQVGGQAFLAPLPMPEEETTQADVDAVHAMLCTVVQDSTAVTENDDDVVNILAMCGGDEGCLLAGARRELDLKHPKWRSPAGLAKIEKANATELSTVVDEKHALRPLPG